MFFHLIFLREWLCKRRLPHSGATVQPEDAWWHDLISISIDPFFDNLDIPKPRGLGTSRRIEACGRVESTTLRTMFSEFLWLVSDQTLLKSGAQHTEWVWKTVVVMLIVYDSSCLGMLAPIIVPGNSRHWGAGLKDLCKKTASPCTRLHNQPKDNRE